MSRTKRCARSSLSFSAANFLSMTTYFVLPLPRQEIKQAFRRSPRFISSAGADSSIYKETRPPLLHVESRNQLRDHIDPALRRSRDIDAFAQRAVIRNCAAPSSPAIFFPQLLSPVLFSGCPTHLPQGVLNPHNARLSSDLIRVSIQTTHLMTFFKLQSPTSVVRIFSLSPRGKFAMSRAE